ncbi:GbsR/MarR family transcriptional regulator [Halobacillus sp. A5]|uniref:GbsR/MarR family transcriptional regulator n=1 Tax=Halobacillus sp. A5 TaxID=2880263 RepID=UPI0020A69887|nr:MarR family transcriptional regulator [Halobacillus sp. A5]MCP3026753.1 MarR family transcriptional regulator [Halobacillus sp. A5]
MESYPNHPLEYVHTTIIHEFSKTLELFGFTPADSRLFSSLYLHGKPMTLDELSDSLGKSKTSISTGVRSLTDQGLVERVWKKGIRKDHYQANEQLFNKFMQAFIKRWIDSSTAQAQALKEIKRSHISPSDDMLCDRLNRIIEFHNQITDSFEKISNGR